MGINTIKSTGNHEVELCIYPLQRATQEYNLMVAQAVSEDTNQKLWIAINGGRVDDGLLAFGYIRLEEFERNYY